MVRRIGSTNQELRVLIRFLRRAANQYNAPIWDYVAELLSKPTRRRVEVNLGRINRVAQDGDTIVVPGKVLGAGTLSKRVTVAAWSFSKRALEVLRNSGEAITIPELVRRNSKGSGVRVVV